MQLTRQQLYDQVWSKPIRKLALEHGLSDVGLSKLCRKHNLPLPPMGHWMKVSHGVHPSRPPLPPLEEGQSEVIEIEEKETDIFDLAKYPELLKEYSAIKRNQLRIELPKSMNDLHPLLKHTYQLLKKARPDTDGRIQPWRGCANILVSPHTLDRATRIMHALFCLFETQGLTVSVHEEERHGTYVKILGERLIISMKEKVKRTDRIQKSEFDQKYDFHALGTLILETGAYYGEGLQRKWVETPSSKLEDKLTEVSNGLIKIALRQRIKQLEWEEKEKKARRERQIKEADKQRIKDEQARFEKLVKDAKDWQNSQTVRAYINAVKASVKGNESPEAKAEREQWTLWAERKADELDPVASRRQSTEYDDVYL